MRPEGGFLIVSSFCLIWPPHKEVFLLTNLNNMPKVKTASGKVKHFPYTKAGYKAATKAKKKK